MNLYLQEKTINESFYRQFHHLGEMLVSFCQQFKLLKKS